MNPAQHFLQLVEQRHSCRAYAKEKPVPEKALRTCLEAARRAPSACNKQPWRFVVIDAPEVLEQIRRKAQLPGIDHSWWDTVPMMVALGIEKNALTHKIAPAFSKIPYHLLDAGIAGEHFVLAAASQGLGTCWIGWFKPKVIKRLIDIPKHVDIVALLTLGYPAGEAGNEAPRKEIEDIAFRNRWGNRLM